MVHPAVRRRVLYTRSPTAHSEFYVQKTYNERTYPARLYTPDDVDTWRRGGNGELDNCMKRDVRTCYDYETAPWSNLVLGEVVNPAGQMVELPPACACRSRKCTSTALRNHRGSEPAGIDGEIHETHHNGCAIITQGDAPAGHGAWLRPAATCRGIRHLPGNPWEKTRIDDPAHEWLLDPNATYWKG